MARPAETPITITIDGREIEAIEGTMLVDAAKHGDVEIPVFCYDAKLGAPVGACRMCLVEIEGIPKLQTACSTPVRDGMVVHTRTEQVKVAQNAVVEFLLVNHPLDCPVCDKGGECPLQDISMGWGKDRSRVVEPKRHFEKPVPLSPLIAIDRERCIMCYRCARFSQEVPEDSQVQVIDRGSNSYIGTFEDKPYIAPFSGNITELCPVGALTSYTYRFQARPWDIEQGGSVCTLCPSQCNVSFTIRDEEVKRVIARDNEAIDDGWLCDRGRYGFQAMYSQDRVINPLRYEDGHPVPATWADALDRAAKLLTAAGNRTAALVGDASNEEGFILQELMRRGLGSNDIDSRRAGTVGRDARTAVNNPDLQALVADIDHADAVLVLGTDPLHTAPAFDLRVRKAVRRNGTRLAVATERPSALDGGATEVERIPVGGSAAWLADLAAAVKAGSEEGIAGLLRGAEDVVILWGERILWGAAGEQAAATLVELAGSLGLGSKAESGLIELPEVANARGLAEVGCLPDSGPGLSAATPGRDVEAIRAGLESGEIEAVILYGVDPLRDFPDTEGWRRALRTANFVISFTMASTETTDLSDVVFPLESHAEKDGTVTHTEGRIQRVRPSAKRPGEIQAGWHVLAELSAAIGHETGIHSTVEALKAIVEAVPFYAGITHTEIGGQGVRWQDREQAGGWEGSVATPDGRLSTAAADAAAVSPGVPSGATTDPSSGQQGDGPATPSLQGEGTDHLATGSTGSGSATGSVSGETVAASLGGGPDELAEEGVPPRIAHAEPPPDGALTLGTYRDIWANETTDLSPALNFLIPAQRLEVSVADAERLGLQRGDEVSVKSGEDEVHAFVSIRATLPEGTCFLIEGTREGNANLFVGDQPALVEIGKATPQLDVIAAGNGQSEGGES
ncbi:MAG: NADH-quinone oxidoreductase subunit NuoG [Solirubrobacterales bacterium]|nr:NADH-quinone oxidoreductase subunit NuoG [Solirubrobacterales bacterium]